MKRGSKNNERGQVAVFFAVAFVFFVVLMMVVVNSAVLTAQKIKLQNTADLAALAGAEMQRKALNDINDLNKTIELSWKMLQTKLLIPVTYDCIQGHATCATIGGPPTPGRCQVACNTADKKTVKKLTNLYNGIRGTLAGKIGKLIDETNKEGHKAVMETLLSEGNVPNDILSQLTEQGTSPKDLSSQYSNLQLKIKNRSIPLKEIYSISDYEEVPLVGSADGREFKDEIRQTIVPKWIYLSCKCELLECKPTPCFLGGINPSKSTRNLAVKIIKTTQKNVHYVVTISYRPIFDFNIFKIGLKGEAGNKLLYEDRPVMMAMAVARASGGEVATLQTKNTITNLVNYLSGLEGVFRTATAQLVDFQHNKITGFADYEDLKHDFNRDLFDKQEFKKEDVWH